MSLADDARLTAVAAAEGAIRFLLWDVHPDRISKVAEAAVQAAAPFLDGSELRRVQEAESGGTVAT